MLGAACTLTSGANGVAFAIPIGAAIPLSVAITASAANFILHLPQKRIAGLQAPALDY